MTLLTGYHYTTETNWKTIQKTGLLPRIVSDDKLKTLRELVPNWDGLGIWVWKDLLEPVAHAGSILFQVATKRDPHIALLRVHFDPSTRLCDDHDNTVLLRHHGSLQAWVYHTKEPAWMVVKPIPKEQITVLDVYDVVTLLQRRE